MAASMSDAKGLRTLEDEISKLKKLLADAMLDNAILKDPMMHSCAPGCASWRRNAGGSAIDVCTSS
jgi:hypothetical protein